MLSRDLMVVTTHPIRHGETACTVNDPCADGSRMLEQNYGKNNACKGITPKCNLGAPLRSQN